MISVDCGGSGGSRWCFIVFARFSNLDHSDQHQIALVQPEYLFQYQYYNESMNQWINQFINREEKSSDCSKKWNTTKRQVLRMIGALKTIEMNKPLLSKYCSFENSLWIAVIQINNRFCTYIVDATRLIVIIYLQWLAPSSLSFSEKKHKPTIPPIYKWTIRLISTKLRHRSSLLTQQEKYEHLKVRASFREQNKQERH